MTSVLLQSGADGVDAAGFVRLTNFGPVVEAGYEWISFYLGGNYGVSSKQVEAAWTAGLPVMLNYERAADAALGGYNAGRTAATTALQQARSLGFDGDAPLIFSGVDFGPTAVQFPTLDGYHRALVDVLGAEGWTGGAYGPRSYLAHLVEQDWWPGDWPLWHWGGDGTVVYPWAWVKQWYGHKPDGLGPRHDNSHIGATVDENTLLKPMKFWSGYGPGKLDPQEDVMTPAQEAKLDVVVAALTHDPGTGITMEWAVQALYDTVAKGHLATQVAQAVVASLPPAQTGGLNVQQVTDACELAVKTVLEQTTYLSVPQFP